MDIQKALIAVRARPLRQELPALFFLLVVRRFVLGAEVQGVFTLFAISFFLMGVILFGIGLVGEYVGRIYQQVRARPRYVAGGACGPPVRPVD